MDKKIIKKSRKIKPLLQKIETGNLYKIVSDDPSAANNYFVIVPLTKGVVMLPKRGEKPRDRLKKPTAKHVLVIGGSEMEKIAKRSTTPFNMPMIYKSTPNRSVRSEPEAVEITKPILVTDCIKTHNTKTQYYLLDIVIGNKIWEDVAYDPTNCKWHLEQVANEDDLHDT